MTLLTKLIAHYEYASCDKFFDKEFFFFFFFGGREVTTRGHLGPHSHRRRSSSAGLISGGGYTTQDDVNSLTHRPRPPTRVADRARTPGGVAEIAEKMYTNT